MNKEEWIEAERGFLERARETGVSPIDEVRKRSGLEFLRAIASGVSPSPPIGKALNFFLLEVEEGRVVFQGEPRIDFYNPIGSIHGGWASALLDSCMACAVQTTLKAGQAYATLELKVNLVRSLAADIGPVRAEGRVIHAGRQVATADCAGRMASSTLTVRPPAWSSRSEALSAAGLAGPRL